MHHIWRPWKGDAIEVYSCEYAKRRQARVINGRAIESNALLISKE
jgi:hypothetical protein